MTRSTPLLRTAVATLTLLASLASAHTWIDCIDHDHNVVLEKSAAWVFGGVKGNGVCEGYIRGYAGRGDADINTKNTYKIARSRLSEPGIPLCATSSADGYAHGNNGNGNNGAAAAADSWRKPVTARAGDVLYFAYLPNGHVAKDLWARTTQYAIYSSGVPGRELSFTTDLSDTLVVNGSRHAYDDLQCGETLDRHGAPSHRAGDHVPCVGSFAIPRDAAPGRHQFVWAWAMYTEGTTYDGPANFVDYLYTSCFDVDVRAP